MTTYTTVLRLAKPALGEANWGSTVNDGVMNLVDDALSGRQVVMTSGAVTLNQVDGAPDLGARYNILFLTGSPSSASTLTCPNVPKAFFITNETAHAVTVGTAVATTTVSIPAGTNASVVCDGSDNFYFSETYFKGKLAADSGTIDDITIGATTPSTVSATNFTVSGATTEGVYAMGAGVDLDPQNGTIQTKTLTANTVLTESMTSGQSLVLQVEGTDTYTLTFPAVTWVSAYGDVAPTLAGNDVIIFWKIGSVLYASYAGNYA